MLEDTVFFWRRARLFHDCVKGEDFIAAREQILVVLISKLDSFTPRG